MGWEGHLLLIDDAAEKRAKIEAAIGELARTRGLLERAGLPCPIVSCGGTGSWPITMSLPGVTEVQAGGVIFMDAFYREKCHIKEFRNALTLLVTVVSRPTPERAIIDAGRKAMNIELIAPQVIGRDDITVERLSAEHGQLRLDPSAQSLKIGERLELIPGYSDLTTVLHNQFYVTEDDRLIDIWRLAARGRLD
jgi:D-serine deaminase-like pyridoxal phosphate-dependent protein